ncbi:MAG TPA: glycosyltransferase [Trebonia sp.]|nr:glycosyltransferase [Trebonia sp.]
MRIALVAGPDITSTDVTGTNTTTDGFARALRDAGHQVTEHLMDGGTAGPRAAVPGLAQELRASWSRTRPEVVHAAGWAGGLAALAAARDAGIPVIAALGSLAMTERRHGLMPELERTRLERAISLAAGAVIAASTEEAADLVRMGVSRRRVHMIPVGVDTAEFTQDGPDAPAIPARRTSARAGDAPKARIVTVADPDDEETVILARAAALVPGAELIAARGQDPGEVAALLRTADVFVHVPAYAPHGLPCLQAMACGVPVVASAVGAHLDMVIDGTTGLLVPPGRPQLLAARIRHLLGQRMLRQACSVAAVDRARSRYSWDRVASETLAVYNRIVEAQQAAA